MKIGGGESSIRVCAHMQARTLYCFFHGDDFVILADQNDLQWFAQHEALLVKVRGWSGADEGDMKK